VHITYYDYERLCVGGLVHEHMCETVFHAVIHGKYIRTHVA